MVMKGASVLNMIRGVAEIARADVKLAVDPNMSQMMTMETCFVILRVIR